MFPNDPKHKQFFFTPKGFDTILRGRIKYSADMGTKIKCGLKERFWYNLYS